MNHKYIQKFETYILNKKDPNKEKEIKNKPKKETEEQNMSFNQWREEQ